MACKGHGKTGHRGASAKKPKQSAKKACSVKLANDKAVAKFIRKLRK